MSKAALAVLLLLVASVQALFDCSQINCNPCQGGNNKVDYLFLLDATTSMGDEIRSVGDGTSRFTASVANRSINARYAVILFGGDPELVVDFTFDANVPMAVFPQIQDAAAVPGLHKRHASREAGYESFRMSQNQAQQNVFDRLNPPLIPLTWRPDALRFIFFVTDEDSDQPYWDVNRFPGQDYQAPPSTISPGSGWDQERTAAIDSLIGSSVYLLALINPGDVPSVEQYGCPSAEVSDPGTYGNFDPAATLANLGSRSECSGSAKSVQGAMLRAGQFVRVFLISELSKPAFVSAFFQVAVLATPACEGSATCFDATCDPSLGCLYTALCDDPSDSNDPNPQCTNNCMISGVCYGFSATKPDNSCLKCHPGFDDWTGCNDNDVCTADLCDPGTGCTGTGASATCTSPGLGCIYDPEDQSVCTQMCGRCFIDGECYHANDPHPNPDPLTGTDCLYCDPFSDDRAWSNMTFLPRCSGTPITPSPGDSDGDSVADSSDNCPFIYNPKNASGLQADQDNDGLGNVCDPCPEDPRDTVCRTIPLDPNNAAALMCRGHGYCGCTASGLGTPACVCDTGYYGATCDLPVICDSTVDARYGNSNCGAHGTCIYVPGFEVPKCECDPGWTEFACTRQVVCSGCDNQFSQCIADNQCSCTLTSFIYDSTILQCVPNGYCPPAGCGGGLCSSTSSYGCVCNAGFKIDTDMNSATYATCVSCPANDATATCNNGATGMASASAGGSSDQCSSDSGCSAGERCLAGTGGNRCVTACADASECPTGEECVARSTTMSNCEKTCSGDADCETGEQCNAAVAAGPTTCTEFFEETGAAASLVASLALLLAF